MSHHRAFVLACLLGLASLLTGLLPAAIRWRWRLLVAVTGVLLGYWLF